MSLTKRWSLHVENWKDCKRCPLHTGRQYVVFTRGSIPADVVFIGEAPGASEDTDGKPFVGPAGELLPENIIDNVIPLSSGVTYALTNLIACIPLGEDGSKVKEPPDDAIQACAPRLIEFIDICNPKLIVCVGKHSEHWLEAKYMKRVKVNPGDTASRDYSPRSDHPNALRRATVIDQATDCALKTD